MLVKNCTFFALDSLFANSTLRKKSPYTESFWSAFFRIRTEYGEILRITPYSVRMRKNAGKYADQNTDFFYAVLILLVIQEFLDFIILGSLVGSPYRTNLMEIKVICKVRIFKQNKSLELWYIG